jgi:hypothetical protein
MADGIVRTPVAKITTKHCGQHDVSAKDVDFDALTLQEDD